MRSPSPDGLKVTVKSDELDGAIELLGEVVTEKSLEFAPVKVMELIVKSSPPVFVMLYVLIVVPADTSA